MSFFSWLQNRSFSRSPRRGPQHRPAAARFRPRLEVLEDRCVPSTLKVTSLADSGKGSLRYEIAQAQSGDTITFDNKGGTITLTSGELDINKNLTIQGPGAGILTVASTGWGNPDASRILEVGYATVTLSGMTISNGAGVRSYNTVDTNDGLGGGVLNFGTLTISGCTLSGNRCSMSGSGIANFGTLTVSGCNLSSNYWTYHGGAIFNGGLLTVSGCTLSGNSGSGIYNVATAGALTVLDSVFSSNSPDNIYGPYTDGGGNSFN